MATDVTERLGSSGATIGGLTVGGVSSAHHDVPPGLLWKAFFGVELVRVRPGRRCRPARAADEKDAADAPSGDDREVIRRIRGFHLDSEGDWVAELDCGHNQHVRHRPPFQLRPWVVDHAGRQSRVGSELECPLCDRVDVVLEPETVPEAGGDPACWAHLFCSECGAEADLPHRDGCSLGGQPQAPDAGGVEGR